MPSKVLFTLCKDFKDLYSVKYNGDEIGVVEKVAGKWFYIATWTVCPETEITKQISKFTKYLNKTKWYPSQNVPLRSNININLSVDVMCKTHCSTVKGYLHLDTFEWCDMDGDPLNVIKWRWILPEEASEFDDTDSIKDQKLSLEEIANWRVLLTTELGAQAVMVMDKEIRKLKAKVQRYIDKGLKE